MSIQEQKYYYFLGELERRWSRNNSIPGRDWRHVWADFINSYNGLASIFRANLKANNYSDEIIEREMAQCDVVTILRSELKSCANKAQVRLLAIKYFMRI